MGVGMSEQPMCVVGIKAVTAGSQVDQGPPDALLRLAQQLLNPEHRVDPFAQLRGEELERARCVSQD
jgi:hypothetical protein